LIFLKYFTKKVIQHIGGSNLLPCPRTAGINNSGLNIFLSKKETNIMCHPKIYDLRGGADHA